MKSTKLIVMIGTIIGLGLSTTAFSAQQFALKGETPTGTRLQQIDATASLPFDKRYFELTEQQRADYRARFSGIQQDEVPPFPRNGLQEVYRPLIDANKNGVSGQLTLNVVVNELGQVEDLKVLDAPNSQVADDSAEVLRKTQFEPAYCAGAPCKMTFPVQIKYL